MHRAESFGVQGGGRPVVGPSRLVRLLLTAGMLLGCTAPGDGTPTSAADAGEASRYGREREAMVQDQLESRGIKDPATLRAMRAVPRHLFVPPQQAESAYFDTPLPIGHGQTISQPYIVAAMTELLQLRPTDRVLEVGTGSGYQAAVLAEIAARVYSIEIVEPLGLEARERLHRLGYDNVEVRIGDGYLGWPEESPFDAVIVTCAPAEVPQPLVDQLKPGGRMCIPVGEGYDQQLYLLTKTAAGRLETKTIFPVLFVPLVRETPGEG